MSSVQLGPRIATVYELQCAWLEPHLEAQGLSWATFQLLTSVAAAGSSASQIEVARRLGITPSTLSESVQAHIKKGLLEQVPSETDRRVKVLRLTANAHSRLSDIRRIAATSEEAMIKGLNAREVEICSKILDQIARRLEIAVESSSNVD